MPKTQNKQAIINGGEEIEILLMSGESETVKVKLLKISQFEQFLKLIDKDEQLAEFLCDKPEGWSDEVAPESLMDIVEKGNDINFTTAFRWAEKRANTGEGMLPLIEKGKKFLSVLPTSVQMPPQ